MSYFSNSELNLLRKRYEALEPQGSMMANKDELSTIAKRVGVQEKDLQGYLPAEETKTTNRDLVSFEEFIDAVIKVKEEKGGIQVNEGDKKIRHHGYKEDTMHTIDEDESISFTHHVNNALGKDPLLQDVLPLDPNSEDLITACKDGILLAKLINDSSPGMIDERALNTSKPLSAFQVVENINLVLNTAKTLDISVINIGAGDIYEGKAHLIFGLIWQVIKLKLTQNVALTKHPELYRLLGGDESLETFLKESPETSIIRWVNHHMKDTPIKPITNLSGDLKDGKVFTYLLSKLDPENCDLSPLESKDPRERSEKILKSAERLGCSKFLTPASLTKANPRLNFAFLADLLDKRTGLESLNTEQLAELDAKLFAFKEHMDSEAKHLLLWMNSMLPPSSYVSDIDNLDDGIVLLKLIDKVYPGVVDWETRVNIPNPTLSLFCKLENTNYVVELSKRVNFSIVGIGGSDITDKQPLAIKSIIHQLMRASMIETLNKLSEGGEVITDKYIVNWATQKVKSNGGKTTITSCKDPAIKTGVFLLELLDALVPRTVNKALITPGTNPDDARLNAQYAISIARKIGATIFTTPEDIMNAEGKMVFIFIGTLMAHHKPKSQGASNKS